MNSIHDIRGFSNETPHDNPPVILVDGKNDFQDAKLRSIAVSKAFQTDCKYWVGRSERMFECGSTLQFAVSNTGERRLYKANFCRDRLCPACQKRRSLVVFHQVKNVCSAISTDFPTYKYVLLTLTVPNVPVADLPPKITDMSKAWGRLVKRKEFSTAVKGWFRTLEITYNAKQDTYHPHYHVLLCVPSGYFKNYYIKQSRWLELWQESMKDHSITQIDVRVIKPNPNRKGTDAISSAAAEVGKYATKPSDYLDRVPNSKERYIASKKIVRDLAVAIRGRKLVAFGGLMLTYSKLLDQQDVDSDSVDLIHTDGDSEQIDAVITQIYRWNIGLNNYVCKG